MEFIMSEVGNETRSTIILFIAILIAVIITVWLILSFDRQNDQSRGGKQSELYMTAPQGNYCLVMKIEDNIS
jgi:hypothetical protein